MNMTRTLSVSMLGLLLQAASAGTAWADPDEMNDPYSQLDPDGVPLAVTQGQANSKPTQADIDAMHKQQQQAAQNKDWLMRSYQQQMQMHSGAAVKDQSNDLYYQLSTNKELARLAGLPVIETDPALHTGVKPGPSETNLRKDPTAEAATSVAQNNLSKPLISPLSSSAMTSISAPMPLAMPSPSSSLLPAATAPTSQAQQVQEAADLDTPGMVAEKKDPLTDTSSSDLSLDILPGETAEQARQHQDDNSNLQLSLPMDADQLHKAQATALNGPATLKPVLLTRAKTDQPTPDPAKNSSENDPNAPIPVSEIPPINPVRAPIPGPFDILRR